MVNPLVYPVTRRGTSGPKVSGSAGGILAYLRLAAIDASVVVTGVTASELMTAMTADIADFILESNGNFALGTNGILTYSGPDISALVRQSPGLYTTGLTAFAFGAVAKNGDIIGEAALDTNQNLIDAGVQEVFLAGAGNWIINPVSYRRIDLTTGDTIQGVFGLDVLAGSSDFTVVTYQLTVELGP